MMGFLSLISLWLAWLFVSVDSSDDMEFLLRKHGLDRIEMYESIDAALSWSFITQAFEIEFKLIAPITETNSWVALGISDTSGMIGADIGLFTWMNDELMYDYHSSAFDTPEMDTIHDWDLISAVTELGHTIVHFSRKLDTCDDEDRPLESKYARFWLMVAYKYEDTSLCKATNFELDTISYHSQRETREVKFWFNDEIYESNSAENVGSDSESEQTFYLDSNFNFTITDINNASDDSRYYCKAFYLTESPIYVTEIQAYAVNSRNEEGINHHMSLYRCPSLADQPGIIDKLNGRCEFGTEIMRECTIFATLLTKNQVLQLPTNIHYELEPTLCVLQGHFELGERTGSYSDSDTIEEHSYMRFLYQQTKRKYPLHTTSSVATFSSLKLPNKQKHVEYTFGLTDSCSNKYFPAKDGVLLLAIGPHMHVRGVRNKVHLIRSGSNRVQTLLEKEYDYDRQFLHWLSNTYIFPNDTLRFHCFYDTTILYKNENSDEDYIVGGSHPRNEMCFFWLIYITLSNDEQATSTLGNFTRLLSDGVVTTSNDNVPIPTSYCGPFSVMTNITTFLTENFEYENGRGIGVHNHELVTYEERQHKKFCKAGIYHELNLIGQETLLSIYSPVVSSNIYIILGCFVLLLLFVTERVVAVCVTKRSRGMMDGQSVQVNKLTVYFANLVVSTVALVLILMNMLTLDWLTYENEFYYDPCKISYHASSVKDNFDNIYAILGCHVMTVFYGIELVYRDTVGWDLVLHHMITVFYFQMSFNIVEYSLSAVYATRAGVISLIEIATEHPIFIALIVRKFDLVSVQSQYNLFLFATFWHCVTKTICTFFLLYISFVNYECSYDIYYHSYRSILFDSNGLNYEEMFWWIVLTQPVLLVVQSYQALVYYRIGRSTLKRHARSDSIVAPRGASIGGGLDLEGIDLSALGIKQPPLSGDRDVVKSTSPDAEISDLRDSGEGGGSAGSSSGSSAGDSQEHEPTQPNGPHEVLRTHVYNPALRIMQQKQNPPQRKAPYPLYVQSFDEILSRPLPEIPKLPIYVIDPDDPENMIRTNEPGPVINDIYVDLDDLKVSYVEDQYVDAQIEQKQPELDISNLQELQELQDFQYLQELQSYYTSDLKIARNEDHDGYLARNLESLRHSGDDVYLDGDSISTENLNEDSGGTLDTRLEGETDPDEELDIDVRADSRSHGELSSRGQVNEYTYDDDNVED